MSYNGQQSLLLLLLFFLLFLSPLHYNPSTFPSTLHRALSTLAHWSSLCAEVDYIPGLVFPFVKLFQNNQLVTFELLATLMSE